MVEPRATYRLQLRPGFGFAEAADLVPYLAGLGVSHLYASPCLEARAGSQHGYDVTDPTRVREELGGAAGLEALVTALRRQGMALLLDIVPNHMAADPAANPWWRDVLEDGRRSPFAAVFDIDWDVPDAELHGRVLAPLLTDGVAAVAGRAELSVVRCRRGLSLRYRDHDLPLAPATVHAILTEAAAGGGASLAAAATAYGDLPDATAGDSEAARQRHAARLDAAATLAGVAPPEAGILEAVLRRVSADGAAILALVGGQAYLLAPWWEAARRINYRRFFSVTDLVGVRVEDQEVFDLTHGLVVDLCRSGVAGGLRVDHVDGLRDPARYLRRLRERTGASWLVVEKILGWDERLPEDWAVDGTTGYEFGALITALFTNPDGVVALDAVAAEVTGEMPDVAGTLMRAKREVMAGELAADVARVARLLEAGAASTRAAAPGGRPAADQVNALVAVAAGLPVYRTYVDPATGRARPEDRAAIAAAVTAARRHAPGVDIGAVEVIGGLLSEPREARVRDLVGRFQQLTPAVTAKGVEDTGFYRLGRLASLAEVGGHPERTGAGVDEFHDACRRVVAVGSRTLLATSTHDTKRSEDVRARLGVLSQVPGDWAEAVRRWHRHNRRHRRDGLPDGATEYLLYQTLVGAHPLSVDRAVAVMRKSVREAKVRTSWTDVDAVYESAVTGFIQAVMGDVEFMSDLATFVEPVARWGRRVSLAQTLLKLTAPGVPDVYQGNELWDLSLVDPDNRRPVDFASRRDMLGRLSGVSAEQAMAAEESGLPKLLVTVRALHLRRARPELFSADSPYTPLAVAGHRPDRAVAFARGMPPGAVTVVPRLGDPASQRWQDLRVAIPPGRWRDALSGDELNGGDVALSLVLRRLPVALLESVA